MKSVRFLLAIMAALCVNAQLATAGPVTVTLLERVENHSKVLTSKGTYGSNAYVLFTFVISRPVGGVTGTVVYTNKYGLEDNKIHTHIGSVSAMRKISDRWNGTFSYTNVSNPKAIIAGFERPTSSSNWFTLSTDFIIDVDDKQTWKTDASYTVGSSFKAGQMLSWRLGWRSLLGPKTDCDVSYQIVYGLSDNAAHGAFTGVYGRDYQASFGYKLDKRTKLQLSYVYLVNHIPGNPGNDSIMRMNVIRMLKTK